MDNWLVPLLIAALVLAVIIGVVVWFVDAVDWNWRV